MSDRRFERVCTEALELAEAERAELAHDLVACLDGSADGDAAKAWNAEIVRRLDEIDTGTAELVNRAEFSRRMRDQLSAH